MSSFRRGWFSTPISTAFVIAFRSLIDHLQSIPWNSLFPKEPTFEPSHIFGPACHCNGNICSVSSFLIWRYSYILNKFELSTHTNARALCLIVSSCIFKLGRKYCLFSWWKTMVKDIRTLPLLASPSQSNWRWFLNPGWSSFCCWFSLEDEFLGRRVGTSVCSDHAMHSVLRGCPHSLFWAWGHFWIFPWSSAMKPSCPQLSCAPSLTLSWFPFLPWSFLWLCALMWYSLKNTPSTIKFLALCLV